MNKDIWKEVYKNYPVNNEYIWLNNCGTTPAGKHIKEEVFRYMEAYSLKGIFSENYNFEDVKLSIQKILAGLLNCSSDDIALIHNTAEGMNFISHGFRFEPGDEILLLENEYPSNVYPWEHLENQSVNIKVMEPGNSPDMCFQNFLSKLSKRTRLVSLSAVHWCTGMPLPIKDIAHVCRERRIDLCLDGAQGVGHVEINVADWDISFMAFSAWKWLLGPLGMGVLVVPNQNIQKLDPVFKGTSSVKNPHTYLPYQEEIIPSAERYMYSTANFLDWIYFKASLEYLDNIGFDIVMKRIHELGQYLEEKLIQYGFRVLSDGYIAPDGSKISSGIIVFDKPGKDVKQIMKILTTHNIIAAERLGRVRLAPHVYNSFEQLDKVMNILKSI